MASTPTKIMTFAEAENLPDPQQGHYELHHGALVEVSIPKANHYIIQLQIQSLLVQSAGDSGKVGIEFGFRALPEYEYRRADVAYLAMSRFKSVDPKGYFEGAPDLVIEVLSPSNTATEIRDKKKLCLENGSREFWTVDIDHREVEVSTPDGHAVTYTVGQQIPLFFAPGAYIPVDAIFS